MPIHRLEQGYIVEAHVPSQRGQTKVSRPAVVISPNNELKAGGNIVVVGITTSYRSSDPPSRYFALEFNPAGGCATGLRRESWAVMDWIEEIPRTAINAYKGQLSMREMTMLLIKINCHGD